MQLMIVVPGSFSYDIWKDIPLPMHMYLYYWNVSNYEEILAALPDKMIKPIMKECGPYVFEETHEKGNEDWNETMVYYSQ